jgi:hypothetical protein
MEVCWNLYYVEYVFAYCDDGPWPSMMGMSSLSSRREREEDELVIQ